MVEFSQVEYIAPPKIPLSQVSNLTLDILDIAPVEILCDTAPPIPQQWQFENTLDSLIFSCPSLLANMFKAPPEQPFVASNTQFIISNLCDEEVRFALIIPPLSEDSVPSVQVNLINLNATFPVILKCDVIST
ncbi:MAG: hypothetical protein EZS28_024467 [Streblomastix strix]|uniref:Uncharacterized protein n=1 Tax=Streblomastix strix TaxID=222440 RepID=A0A5J4VC39_9EUKA|nr:MAG: hypothetical protein EZS28_024467 [Streblomastix strix]